MCERGSSNFMKKAIAYYRVSTQRQGRSGLGLNAQQDSVHLYTKTRQIDLVYEFTEVESTSKSKRPVLQQAIDYCTANGTLLIIAKLDRLGRNVAFIAALMESHVEFVAVDNPQANQLTLHILAAVAQYEREQISQRTKQALQAAKKRGVKLGSNGKVLAHNNKQRAKDFAKKIEPVILAIRKDGFVTVQAITDELNKRKIETYRPGAKWHKSRVYKLISLLLSP